MSPGQRDASARGRPGGTPAAPGRPGPGRAVILGIAGALLAVTLAAGPVRAQGWLDMTTARQADGASRMDLRVEYAAGQLRIGPAEEGLLYEARLRYRGDAFRPLRDYQLSDGTARVRLGLQSRNGRSDLDLDWSSLRDLDLGDLDDASGEARLEVGIAREVPTALEVTVGAAEAEMELGGLPLTELLLTSGASETSVRFDAPNPSAMERMEVKAGAAEMELSGLAHAAPRRLRVEGAVGDVTLDFTGDWRRDMDVTVKVGLGSLTLRIPSDVGVRLQRKSLLSSFSGFGLQEADDGSYRSENWSQAEHRLELSVDAAFGSIDVVRLD